MENKKVKIAKDFLAIKNKEGHVMFVLLYNKATKEPSTDAHILYGKKGPHAVLVKNDDHAIILDYLDKDTLKMMKGAQKATITEIEYNEDVLKYNLNNPLDKKDIHKLFKAAEAHHALKACYEVNLEEINDFDERFSHFIDEELKKIK